MNLNFEPGWKNILNEEFIKPYFIQLKNDVKEAYQSSTIYPSAENIFQAFNLCPFETVKVVIIGQDPYHGENQAHGLSFSVPNNIKIPPSLKNIYKEIEADTGKPISASGNLEHWAKQGVLLLNTTLTVAAGQPGSHHHLGWNFFTDAVIKNISTNKKHVVFLLWGKYAETKISLIDTNKHLVLLASHPSPFSAYKGFFGCRHFTKTNEYLKTHHQTPITW